MKRLIFFICVALQLIVSCGGPGEIREWQPDFSDLDAYDWGEWDVKPPALADFQKEYPALDSLMKSTLYKELVTRGYKYDSREPDFLVYYYFTVKELTTVRERHARYGAVGSMPEFRQYEEGRLIIDFVKVGSMDMVWSGDAGDIIEENLAPQQRRERVRSLIKQVLEEVPDVK